MLVCLSCNPRFHHRVDHLHSLGSRAVGEFPAELAPRHCIEDDRAARLDDRRRRLTLETVAAPGVGSSPGVPSVPDIGADDRRREREGKKLWRPINSFSAPDARARWQRTVLAALTAAGIGGAS
jgi:hypothetical protein